MGYGTSTRIIPKLKNITENIIVSHGMLSKESLENLI